MNVLIASGIFPPDIGGPATYVPSLAAALAGRGDAITVVTMSDEPHPDAYPFRVVRVLRRGGPAARWGAALRALLRAGRDAEVVYAVGLLPQSAAANLRLRRPLVARVVGDLAWDRATVYGWTTDDLETFQVRRHGLRIEVVQAVQHWAIRRAVRVIVPSEWLASWMRRVGVPPARLRMIPNALAPLPAVHVTRPHAPTPYLIAMVGRLVPVKRIDLAIRALRDLPEASLLLIGDGPQRGALQQLAAELALTDRVIFAGARARGEMLGMLAGSDALVLCSAHEGFPHVLLEAMSLGVPVIATPVRGIVEIVADGVNGLLLDAATAPALGHALRVLLADTDRRRELAERARVDVGRRFRFDTMVDTTRGVLAEAVR
ncbi:MAG TPA: glycosyltransferase family 4 protein [bacterium]